VLMTPEIAGLPYVYRPGRGGGLAAALSTADGLLLTIANALGTISTTNDRSACVHRAPRFGIQGLLLVVAVIAAYTASLKPGNILFLVGAAFSLAASSFPALVLASSEARQQVGAITACPQVWSVLLLHDVTYRSCVTCLA